MPSYFSNETLLKTPGKRAAFSDRTAYLMAEMSRLAYFRFEGGNNIADVLANVKELMPAGSDLTKITEIVKSSLMPSTATEGEKLLTEILDTSGFELVATFNAAEAGAQGLLCRHKEDNFAVLAFRGTEMNLKDIRTDAKARLATVTIRGNDTLMHSGYLKGSPRPR